MKPGNVVLPAAFVITMSPDGVPLATVAYNNVMVFDEPLVKKPDWEFKNDATGTPPIVIDVTP